MHVNNLLSHPSFSECAHLNGTLHFLFSGAMTSALSLGGLSGGFLLANLGFNNTWLFALCIVIPAPILIVICFHPAVMGR